MHSRTLGLLFVAMVVAACGGESIDTTTAVPDTTTTIGETTTTSAVGGDSTSTTTAADQDPYTFDIVLEDSEVTGGGRISVPLGETVTLRFTSDVADEVHIHGYDIFVELEPGATVETSFVADIPGVVELETHNGGLVLANLEAS